MTEDSKDKRLAFSMVLERAINGSDKTQLEIANMCGYANANIITMMKRGTTRLPLEKVAVMARALDLDPSDLINEWFRTYMPDAMADLIEYGAFTLNRQERSWVQALRRVFETVPPYDTKMDEILKRELGATSS